MRLCFIATFVLFALIADAQAWGRDGHRAVCLIAWEGLSPAARDKVRELLDIETPEQFADQCNWADDVRRERRNTSSWHFLDSPPGKTINMRRDCPKDNCIVARINHDVGVLKGDAPKAEKAEALKFLAHFVGDVHQPLHVAVAGNQGGNGIKTRFEGKLTNLHTVWDSRLLEVRVKPGEDAIVSILRDANAAKGLGRRTSLNPLIWARESRKLALAPATAYADNPAELDLQEDYIKANYPVAVAQIRKAGSRLAQLLDSVHGR